MAAPAWLTGAALIAQRTLAPLWPGRLTAVQQPAAQGSEAARETAAQSAAAAVAGLFPEPLATPPGETRDTVRVNLVLPIVRATVAYLFGTPPQWTLPDAVEAEEKARQAQRDKRAAAAQPPSDGSPAGVMEAADAETDTDDDIPEDERVTYMKACLAAMNWPGRLLDLGWNGATFGTPAWRIREADAQHEYPYVQVLAPDALRIHTNPRDIEDVTGYAYQLTATDPQTGLPVIWRQRIERNDMESPTGDLVNSWTIIDETAQLDGRNGWVDTSVWDVVSTEEWPYAWPPILHCKNLPHPNSVYGAPDVTETLIESNLAINRSLTGTARIDRRHAGPRVWLKNMSNQVVDTRKAIIELPDGADIGQLVPAVDASHSIAYRAELREGMCEESGTPSIVLGRPDNAGRSDPSGIALRLKLAPLVTKTEMKRTLYGPLLTETLRRLWELGGYGPDCVCTWTWPELIPSDPLEERNVLKADSDLGIASKETIAGQLGYDWDQERDKIEAERAATTPPALLPGTPGQPPPQSGEPMDPAQMQEIHANG